MYTFIKNKFKKNKSIFILIFLLLIIAVLEPSFYRFANLKNLFLKVSIQGIIGMGMTFVLLGGEFDMSVGSILTLSGIVFASAISKTNFFVALILALLVGIITGLINGTLVAKLKINSFIATLGVQYIYKAIALLISDGQPVKIKNDVVSYIGGIRILGNSIFPYLFIITALITYFVLKRTQFGRNIYATGGNYDVARNSGIDVEKYKIYSFVIVCFTAAIAGVLMTTRLQTASTIAGDDTSLTVISSVIVGGTLPTGGVGGAIESFVGLFIIATITTVLDLIGVSGYYQQFVQGTLTVVIIGITSYLNYLKKVKK